MKIEALRQAARLVVATHNVGKLREIAALLTPLGLHPVSAGELGVAEPEETESTFAGNALLKARASAEATGLPALADDSGLEVFALDGDPGVYSARWGGPQRDFRRAMEQVWRELQTKSARDFSARFVCVLALALPGGEAETFEGEASGQLVWPPRGDRGFGYDPMFMPAVQPTNEPRTFGEMSPEEKLPLTHRAKAFAKLVAALS